MVRRPRHAAPSVRSARNRSSRRCTPSLIQEAARLSKKSDLGKAAAYLLDHWPGLVLFPDDGRIEMESNPVESRIRPLTLGQKNALFAGHDEGGRSWARFASVIGTCRLKPMGKPIASTRGAASRF
ncbi:hypothetical protein D1122_21585 [Cereibacter sphaeroides]|uniref:IS66 family transposase n=1 Tax=Cereibacter sphaeroides TaxID=1063 RepID=UPI000E5BBA8A|nr:transposase [Cereibacter sphaeroides]RHZ91120.1 hypothetical protein D1122_21585 [Cereibacter sphaeroides]